MENQFTKYERARIIGARGLQIAMDAPLLLKIDEEKLKEIRFDALKIAEMEFENNVLPIAISRPSPQKKKDRLSTIREEKVSDDELIAKEQELEKEIAEDAKEMGLVNEGDEDEAIEESEGSKEE